MEKIWYNSYDPGVPRTVDPDQYTSLNELIEESFSKYSEKPAFINFGEKLSFKTLDELSRAFAGYLISECKLVKGDRVAILMPNCLQYPVAMFGALRAGLIVVNINPWSKRKDIHRILKKTGSKCIVFSNIHAAEIEHSIHDLNINHLISTQIGDLLPFFKRTSVNMYLKYVKNMVQESHLKNVVSFPRTILAKYVNQFQKPQIQPNDIAFLLYTEGRRYGVERCVMISHRNMIANALQGTSWLESFFRDKHEEAMVNPFPLSKAICIVGSLVMMRVGFATILITDPLDTHAFVAEIKKTPFSLFYGVNSLFTNLLQNNEFRHLDFSKMKYTAAGGMTVFVSTSEKWKELTGCSIQQGFGLVETTAVAMMPPVSSRSYHENIGLPTPSTEIKVCDSEGKELAIGETGELCIKGPQVALGYWGDPEMTKLTIDEQGWLRTGDIARVDEKGFVYLVDRLEDVMIKHGKKVYATLIERALSNFPGVQEVGVVGIMQPSGEHHITAYIIKADPSLTKDNILTYSMKKLKEHEIPDQIEFTKILPHSIAGFLLRRVLREEAVREMRGDNNG